MPPVWRSLLIQARCHKQHLEHPVQKLQEMIDAAFGTEAKRTAQHPSEAFLERERILNEQARKIQALRQARMRDDGSKQSPVLLTLDVVRYRGHWRVRHRNKYSTPYPDQPAAILAAKKLAREKRESGRPVEVRLMRTDGQVVVQSIDDEQETPGN